MIYQKSSFVFIPQISSQIFTVNNSVRKYEKRTKTQEG